MYSQIFPSFSEGTNQQCPFLRNEKEPFLINKHSASHMFLLFSFLTGIEYDDDLNDEISVQQILRDMLDKEVVEKDILNDLGFDGSKKRKDPRPKMELRHKQVSMIIYRCLLIIANK